MKLNRSFSILASLFCAVPLSLMACEPEETRSPMEISSGVEQPLNQPGSARTSENTQAPTPTHDSNDGAANSSSASSPSREPTPSTTPTNGSDQVEPANPNQQPETATPNPAGVAATSEIALHFPARPAPKAKPQSGFWSDMAFSPTGSGLPCVTAEYEGGPTRIVSAPGETTVDGKDVVLRFEQSATLHAILAGKEEGQRIATTIESKLVSEGWTRSVKEILSGRGDAKTIELDGTILKFVKERETKYLSMKSGVLLYAIEKNGESIVGRQAQGSDLGAQLITLYIAKADAK